MDARERSVSVPLCGDLVQIRGDAGYRVQPALEVVVDGAPRRAVQRRDLDAAIGLHPARQLVTEAQQLSDDLRLLRALERSDGRHDQLVGLRDEQLAVEGGARGGRPG